MTIPEFGSVTNLGQPPVRSAKIDGITQGSQKTAKGVQGTASAEISLSSVIGEFENIISRVHALPDIREEALYSVRDSLAGHGGQVAGKLVAAGVIKETVLNTVTLS